MNPNGYSNSLWWANPETKRKFLDKMRNRNPQFKGDNVGYSALHGWLKRNLVKPESCKKCGLVGPVDIANISGKYLRDASDYEWLCRRCHMLSDNRMFNLKQYGPPTDYTGRECNECKSSNTRVRKSGCPLWFKDEKGWKCDKCYHKHYAREYRRRCK